MIAVGSVVNARAANLKPLGDESPLQMEEEIAEEGEEEGPVSGQALSTMEAQWADGDREKMQPDEIGLGPGTTFQRVSGDGCVDSWSRG